LTGSRWVDKTGGRRDCADGATEYYVRIAEGMQRLNWRMKCSKSCRANPVFRSPTRSFGPHASFHWPIRPPRPCSATKTTPDSGAVPPARTPKSCGVPLLAGSPTRIGDSSLRRVLEAIPSTEKLTLPRAKSLSLSRSLTQFRDFRVQSLILVPSHIHRHHQTLTQPPSHLPSPTTPSLTATMPPPIVTATLQTAVISAISNILAQAITAHQSNVRSPPCPSPF